MRDITHKEELERWANYVKNNPDIKVKKVTKL